MKVYFLIAECSLSSAKILKIEGDSLEKVEEFQIIPQKKCGLYFPEKGCHLGTNRSDNET